MLFMRVWRWDSLGLVPKSWSKDETCKNFATISAYMYAKLYLYATSGPLNCYRLERGRPWRVPTFPTGRSGTPKITETVRRLADSDLL